MMFVTAKRFLFWCGCAGAVGLSLLGSALKKWGLLLLEWPLVLLPGVAGILLLILDRWISELDS